MITEFAGLGIVGLIGGYLFTTFMKERAEERKISIENQKEDRELFRKSVETFTETSKTYAESITSLTVRVENVEESTERIETKLDKVLDNMKIAITVGHSILKNGTCTSAKGEVLEYAYCKELAPIVQKYLKFKGHQVDVIICPEREFTKASQEKTYKLGKVNGNMIWL